jgi:hypothetical protein
VARLELGVDITVEGARELSKVSDSLSGTSDELDELAQHLDDAADSARKMSDDIDAAAGSLNFDKASAGMQTLEDSGEGVRNTVNGLTDVFSAATDESASFGERLALGAGGIADVASGARNAIIPALAAIKAGSLSTLAASAASFAGQIAGWIATAAAAAANAIIIAAAWVVALGPVGLLVGAIIAAVALIILNWDKVTAFIEAAVAFMVELFEGFAAFFTETWEGIMDFLSGIGEAIAGFAESMWKPIGTAFEAVIDFLKGVWNTFVGFWNGIQITVPSVDLPLIGRVGGFTIGLPDLPRLAEGGIVDRPTLALIGEGNQKEAVIPLDRLAGMGTTVNLTINGDVTGDERRIPGQVLRGLYVAGIT